MSRRVWRKLAGVGIAVSIASGARAHTGARPAEPRAWPSSINGAATSGPRPPLAGSERAGTEHDPAQSGPRRRSAPRDLVNRAVERARDGDWAGAERLLRTALDSAPRLPEAQLGLGVSLTRAGQHEQALAALHTALRLAPGWTPARTALALAQLQAGQLTEALASWDTLLRAQPSDARAHFNRGVTLERLGREVEALAAYDLAPALAEAHAARAGLLLKRGEPAGAARACREALRRKPDLAEGHYHLALALHALGDEPGALAAVRHALRLRPAFLQAQRLLEVLQARVTTPALG